MSENSHQAKKRKPTVLCITTLCLFWLLLVTYLYSAVETLPRLLSTRKPIQNNHPRTNQNVLMSNLKYIYSFEQQWDFKMNVSKK